MTPPDTLAAIAAHLNGTLWDADTLDAIADLVRAAGFPVGDPAPTCPDCGDGLTDTAGLWYCPTCDCEIEPAGCPECERSHGPHYHGPCPHGTATTPHRFDVD